MRKHLLKDLDKIIETATKSAFSDLLGPLLEDERKKQDDMAARTKDLDAGDATEIDDQSSSSPFLISLFILLLFIALAGILILIMMPKKKSLNYK